MQINTTVKEGWRINHIVEYIKNNSDKKDKVVVYPEGLIINYLSDRPTENFYYSVQPPYLEAFGEENLIKYYKKNKPKFFVIRNTDMIVYNKKYICESYAFDFCKFLKQNYKPVETIQTYDFKKERIDAKILREREKIQPGIYKIYKRID